jgi:1-acyl-sn-glycerol-3-phosphate acyltransferase
MRQVAKKCKQQQCGLWMYPEGTRSYQSDNTLLPFKKGAFHIAAEEQIPIVPVVMSTYAPYYDEVAYRFEPCSIQIKILDPIVGTNVDELLKETQDRMQACLSTLKTTGNDAALEPSNRNQEWLEKRN